MCLGEVCEVVGLEPDGRLRVRGVTRDQVVSPMAIEGGVEIGDWLVAHSGFALGRLTPEEAKEALAIRAATSDTPADSAPAAPASAHDPGEANPSSSSENPS